MNSKKLIKGGHTSHLPLHTSNRGITLIALVITIIVLLILAGVTINMVLGDDGIIQNAQKAKEANEKGIGREEGAISDAIGILSRYNISKYENVKDANGIAKQNSTINGEKGISTNPVIPKGFKHLLGTVDEGFVIQDEEGNEFVWVPVEDTTDFETLTPGYSNGTQQTWVGREPDLVTGKTTDDGMADLVNGTSYDANEINRKAILDDGYENTNEGLKEQFEDEYNSMVESVKAYGGFYVGRYETGWNEEKGVVVSKSGVPMIGVTLLESSWATSATSNGNKATWYGLYKKQKELYKKNSSSSVVSGMIYGCQWDAIMNWMLSSADDDVRTFVSNSTGKGNYNGIRENTGGTGYDVNNIFDLAGNYYEWTREASGTGRRVLRGSDAFRQ